MASRCTLRDPLYWSSSSVFPLFIVLRVGKGVRVCARSIHYTFERLWVHNKYFINVTMFHRLAVKMLVIFPRIQKKKKKKTRPNCYFCVIQRHIPPSAVLPYTACIFFSSITIRYNMFLQPTLLSIIFSTSEAKYIYNVSSSIKNYFRPG